MEQLGSPDAEQLSANNGPDTIVKKPTIEIDASVTVLISNYRSGGC
jgi:hypothetical protein